MEELQRLLGNTLKQYIILRDTLQEVRSNNDTRAERNAKLRRRLEGMKSDVTSQMNAMMADLFGVDPKDVLSDAEINKHLTEACNLFNWDFFKVHPKQVALDFFAISQISSRLSCAYL